MEIPNVIARKDNDDRLGRQPQPGNCWLQLPQRTEKVADQDFCRRTGTEQRNSVGSSASWDSQPARKGNQ